jgi:UDP-3-O-[3-hydroxymyristoyl] glucosamine N-acyltransferase LpxD
MIKTDFTSSALECAEFLNLELHGNNVNLHKVGGLEDVQDGCLKFCNTFDKKWVDTLNKKSSDSFVIAHIDFAKLLTVPHVLSDNPRLDFCKLTNHFFNLLPAPIIEGSAFIGKNVDLGSNVYLGHNVVIEDDVKIGSNSTILHNVVISKGTQIGKCCLIKSGTAIGQRGFGFERNENGVPISFPHFGNVVIGDDVEIGALNTIVAGGLTDTMISNNVKTDDHVHIAHNVNVGSGTLITACVEISGSVTIGENVWLGPNCSIIDKVSIGDNSIIGIGSVVINSVEAKSIVAGNPAKILKRN